MTFTIHRLDAARVPDFFRVLGCEEGSAWCACVAWHVPTWDGFSARTAAENRALRDAVLRRRLYDGYLAYAGEEPVGWCQVAPRDALARTAAFALPPDPGAWAVTCFEVRPDRRRSGVARALLEAVLADLPARGATRVEAFPKRGVHDPADLWNGPEALFRSLGFEVAVDDPARPVLARDLLPPALARPKDGG